MAMYSLVTASGTSIELDSTNNVVVLQTYGLGMPPVANQVTDYALLDGGSFQRSKVQPRVMMLTLEAVGDSWAGNTTGLHAIRAKLVNAANPHRHGTVPMRLNYTGNTGETRYLNCHYEAGLEMGEVKGYTEQMTLRLLAPDPFWYANTAASGTAPANTTATLNRVALWTDGAWSNMGSGAPDGVYALAAKPGGGVYAGGQFNTIGSTAAVHVAAYASGAWSALGGGVLGTEPAVIVSDVALAPNGDVYVAGQLFRAGATAVQNIAVRDISAGAWAALGAGLTDAPNAMAFDNTGILYVGGTFNTAGGVARRGIAAWNGTVWGTVGGGLPAGRAVNAIAVDRANVVYVGGTFSTIGAVPVKRIAKWNGSTWNTLGAGLPNTVYALEYDRAQGYLYAGGVFTTAGGATVNRIARWNGRQWQPLGVGVNNQVTSLKLLSDGNLIVSGDFTKAGGKVVGRVAMWNGYSWVSTPADFNGSMKDVAEDASSGALYYGGTFSGTKTVSGRKTLTNAGSARAYPVITITASAASQRVLYIRNDTTDQVLWFDYLLQDSETLTIDCAPGAKTVTSSFYGGNVGDNPLPGSQLATFCLNPGSNYISTLVSGASTTVTFAWRPAYWGGD